jgi:two-component system, OmpR family, sensor histidine kinase SenX3
VAVVVAVLAGVLIGVVATTMAMSVRGRRKGGVEAPTHGVRTRRREPMPAETVLELLPTGAVLVDANDNVRLANGSAVAMGIVRGDRIEIPELRRLVRRCRQTGQTQIVELVLDSGGFPRRVLDVGARAEALPGGDVALVVDDVTESKRVESVRRDFVANVGHEVKTPVGALTLLAEAALEAGDDPVAVQRFLTRIQHEAARLSRLVQELLDLSRLQGGEPLPDRTVVPIDAIVDEAVDRSRLVAEVKQIELVRGDATGLSVSGSERQLVTAVANLLDNAVAYSPPGTRVAVGVRQRDDTVELAVSDQGIGIDGADQGRIFERFYRVDQARSRETGGTGLGLAIVKHIVNNHGGEVSVWSQPGAGSTFTVRLPLVTDADDHKPPAPTPDASDVPNPVERAGTA